MTAMPSLPERALPGPKGVGEVLSLPAHTFLRGDTALQLARFLLAAHPHLPLSATQLARLNDRLPVRLAVGSRRERARMLAVCAALGPALSPATRAAVRRMSHLDDPDADAAESVAAHVTSLLADGYPVSDHQLVDLAALVRSPATLLTLAGPGSPDRRAIALVLAIAERVDDPALPPV